MADNEVQRWADPAMYAAAPVPEGGPRVYLLEATPDPLGSIAAAAALYEGGVRRSKREVTHEERHKYLTELQKTKIQAPLEFVQFHFLFEGVTRGFTHQLVRQRTATFVQESTRFAVKEDVPVGLPPSLAGTEITGMYELSEDPKQRWRDNWERALVEIRDTYNDLVNAGMPAEDARGLLPTNLLTRVHYSTDLRALLDHAGNRLCTQAQFEWRQVFALIAKALRDYNPFLRVIEHSPLLDIEVVEHLRYLGESDRWQYAALADLLQPVCYQRGRCAFDASFDRSCSIRSRVQANHEIGRPPGHWGDEHDVVEGNPVVAGVGPHSVVRDESGKPVFIGAIHPREWLTDPGAAR